MFLLLIAALTSALAVALVRRRHPSVPLRRAVGRAFECVALVIVFFVANLAVGVLVVLAVRATGRFVSMYGLSDPTLVLLAVFQALVVHHWLVERSPDRPC